LASSSARRSPEGPAPTMIAKGVDGAIVVACSTGAVGQAAEMGSQLKSSSVIHLYLYGAPPKAAQVCYLDGSI